jgi:K+-transporting ATPase ATPase C chain
MKTLLQSLRILFPLTLLTGVIYPVVVTDLAGRLFADQANGSLLKQNGKLVGSSLLAQHLERDDLFWPRPSSADYATIPSGASNLGPTSAALAKAVEERKKLLGSNAPVDLLTASGSGLDPHISPDAAHFQIHRIATARHLPENQLLKLVDEHTEPPQFGVFGSPRVNVLTLNLALLQLH